MAAHRSYTCIQDGRKYSWAYSGISAQKKHNQIIVSTHSPVFVTPNTIDTINRVYQSQKSSTQVSLRGVHLPERKTLVRMINSQNHERLFFADKVVLVEGISDRLVFESLLENAFNLFGINIAIEVIEVGGKQNFEGYREILKGLRTSTITVADLDYLTIVGQGRIQALFTADYEKQWRALTTDKKSADGRAMIALLERAIASSDTEELGLFLEFLSARRKRLKAELTEEESQILGAEYSRLEKKGMHLLRKGELEDYLPPGGSDVSAIIPMVSDRNWLNSVRDTEARVELGEIICAILELGADKSDAFLSDVASAEVVFPTSTWEQHLG